MRRADEQSTEAKYFSRRTRNRRKFFGVKIG